MFKKINEFLDAPLTYRRCLKITGIMYLVLIPIYIVYLVKIGLLDVKECWEGVKDFFRKIHRRMKGFEN